MQILASEGTLCRTIMRETEQLGIDWRSDAVWIVY